MQKYKDMTGQRFGRLIVLRRVENDAQGNAQWLCRCDCGNEKVVRGGMLRQGKTVSCGCLLSERSRDRMTKMLTKHGQSGTPLYNVWSSMIDRCYRTSCKGFPRYGGRGIRVYDEWRNSFAVFYLWAMNNGYQRGLEIDRINNDGPYAPWNCRWITSKENCRNTSTCVAVCITDLSSGESITTSTIQEASEITGVNHNTIRRMMRGIKTSEVRYSFGPA